MTGLLQWAAIVCWPRKQTEPPPPTPHAPPARPHGAHYWQRARREAAAVCGDAGARGGWAAAGRVALARRFCGCLPKAGLLQCPSAFLPPLTQEAKEVGLIDDVAPKDGLLVRRGGLFWLAGCAGCWQRSNQPRRCLPQRLQPAATAHNTCLQAPCPACRRRLRRRWGRCWQPPMAGARWARCQALLQTEVAHR